MARGFTLALTVLLLTSVSGFGQIMIGPGIGFPGRRQNPNNPNNPNNRNNQSSQTTLVGMLRSISGSNVVIESDDNVVTTVQVPGSTKWVSETGGKAQIGDFQPGDKVTIDTTQDNNQNYRAKTITMIREGTPEEHAGASQPLDSWHPGSSSGSSRSGSSSASGSSSSNSPGDDDPDRPRIAPGWVKFGRQQFKQQFFQQQLSQQQLFAKQFFWQWLRHQR